MQSVSPNSSIADRVVSALSRVTSSGSFVPVIDGMRFFAIATVFLYHANIATVRALHPQSDAAQQAQILDSNFLTSVFNKGNVGVPVFFAISGFILGLPFALASRGLAPPVRLPAYFLRRVTRLEPPYLASLLLAALLHAVTLTQSLLSMLPGFLASLVYLHMLVFGRRSDVNPVAWSLEIEVQFYILAPLLSRLLRIQDRWWRRGWILALMVPSIIMRSFLDSWLAQYHLDLSILGYGFYFLVGFLVLDLYLDLRDRTSATGHLGWDVSVILGMVLLLMPVSMSKFLSALIFVPACFLFMTGCLFSRHVSKIFLNRWIVIIGGMCYSIYLLHYGIVLAAVPVLRRIGLGAIPAWAATLLVATLLALVILPVCAAFFVMIEKPCMRRDWPQRLRERIHSGFMPRPLT